MYPVSQSMWSWFDQAKVQQNKIKQDKLISLFQKNALTLPDIAIDQLSAKFSIETKCKTKIYVTQHELMRLFEGDIKTDILNSTYCSISKEHFDIKTMFIQYSYQKL